MQEPSGTNKNEKSGQNYNWLLWLWMALVAAFSVGQLIWVTLGF
ncbi:hypothetical protein [Dyadobacter sandarakinus]|nr:hypothetical protein [Dyadobacter sandarakinus]